MPFGYHLRMRAGHPRAAAVVPIGVSVIDRLTPDGYRQFDCLVAGRFFLEIDTMGGGMGLVVGSGGEGRKGGFAANDDYWLRPAAPDWVLPAFLAGEPIGPIIDCLIESNPDWTWLAEAAAVVAPHLGACDRSDRRGR
jgi:hypothetical protein